MNEIIIALNNIDTRWIVFSIVLVLMVFSLSIGSIVFFRSYNLLSVEQKKEVITKLINMLTVNNLLSQIVSSFILINRDKPNDDNKTEKPFKLKEIDDYIREEYNSSKTTRMIFINIFVIFTLSIIICFLWFDKISYELRLAVGCLYVGFSFFVLFIIKSCYARTAVILSILEDRSKKEDLEKYFIKYKKSGSLNEYDVEFLRLIYVSRSERERKAAHPYEMILKNIEGSSFNFGKGGIKVEKDKK